MRIPTLDALYVLQVIIWQQSMSAWFVTLIACQFWNIWVCKTRTVSIFKHGVLHNHITLFGVLLAIGTMLIITYVPFLNPIFDSYHPVDLVWVWNVAFFGLILALTEGYKCQARRRPFGFVARQVAW